ncbi:MAG: YceI family protein [Pseudomonadota bacterium]
MSFKAIAVAVAALVSLSAQAAHADTWTLDGDESKIAFGSIKNNQIGEVSTFKTISGGVDDGGTATVEIDLGSLDTKIDIRNERMIKHVFNAIPSAKVSAAIDMNAVSKLGVGDTMVLPSRATLSFLGKDLNVSAELFIARLAEDKVLVATADMIMFSTTVAGIDPGIDVLREIASLQEITRVAPVTLRLVFERS